jgi:hypothetical protein
MWPLVPALSGGGAVFPPAISRSRPATRMRDAQRGCQRWTREGLRGEQTEGDAQQSFDYRRLDADETDGQSARTEWPIVHQE